METTVPGEVVKHGTVSCVGYTDMESRMGTTASFLFGGNVTNFLLSMEDKETKKWALNLDDPAVRSVCVAVGGEALPPYVPPEQPAAAAAAAAAKAAAADKKKDCKPRDHQKVQHTVN